MMCYKMMLVAYDLDKPHRVVTDASDEGIGYTFQQKHDDEECTCKKRVCTCKWRILWANSTTLKPGYKHIPAIYLKEIGIRWALQDAQFYLKGNRKPFEKLTDHHALVPLFRKELPDLHEKLKDIIMDMRPYNLVMKHIPGKKNLMSDALSRMPNTTPRRWIADPTTEEMDAEFCRQVLGRQVKATDTN